jgi:hypothetical protein
LSAKASRSEWLFLFWVSQLAASVSILVALLK